jgi:hypothetical protein
LCDFGFGEQRDRHVEMLLLLQNTTLSGTAQAVLLAPKTSPLQRGLLCVFDYSAAGLRIRKGLCGKRSKTHRDRQQPLGLQVPAMPKRCSRFDVAILEIRPKIATPVAASPIMMSQRFFT